MVAIDTDVLLLAFAFHNDQRQPKNTQFLAMVQEGQPAVAIYSVMELLGQLSFNLSADRLIQWPSWLRDRYQLTILYPQVAGLSAEQFFSRELVDRPLEKMHQRMPFMDTLILNLIEAAFAVDTFVTWNARHFKGKTPIAVVTPAQYVASSPV